LAAIWSPGIDGDRRRSTWENAYRLDLKIEAQRETGDAGKASHREQNALFAAGFAADVRAALTYVSSSLSPANFIFTLEYGV
jgi:hypothetical protein